jgi:hypothetical protein
MSQGRRSSRRPSSPSGAGSASEQLRKSSLAPSHAFSRLFVRANFLCPQSVNWIQLTGLIRGTQDPHPGAAVRQTRVRQRGSRASKQSESEPKDAVSFFTRRRRFSTSCWRADSLRSVTSRLTTALGALPILCGERPHGGHHRSIFRDEPRLVTERQRRPATFRNDIRSMDFVADQLADGRRFRALGHLQGQPLRLELADGRLWHFTVDSRLQCVERPPGLTPPAPQPRMVRHR